MQQEKELRAGICQRKPQNHTNQCAQALFSRLPQAVCKQETGYDQPRGIQSKDQRDIFFHGLQSLR